MPIVLSIDVGTVSMGYVLYNPRPRQILCWGAQKIKLQNGSYMRSITAFEEQCCSTYNIEVVLIERQLRNFNHQAGRVEANLEGYFRDKDKSVHVMAAGTKYSSHGLQLPACLSNRFQTWAAAALAKSSTNHLSPQQQYRLNKKKAKEMANYFLQCNSQSPAVLAEYDSAAKQDDMADALLQALAYAKVVLSISPHQPEVIVID